MINKVYTISGFDCANCASKAEMHLAKQKDLFSVRLDFSANKLFITYKDEPYTIEKLKEIIKEVESDPINISDLDKKPAKNTIFTKNMMIMIVRILLTTVLALLTNFLVKDPSLYWLRFSLFLLALVIISYDIVYKVFYHIFHLENPVDEYLLILVAIIGAFIKGHLDGGDFLESVLVVLLFQLGRVIESYATNKSKFSIMSAMDLRVEKANLVTSNGVEVIASEELKKDDIVIVNAGESIPGDGIVISGNGYIDTSSYNGELVPIYVDKNEEITSGCILKSGSINIKLNKDYKDCAVNKINDLIKNSGDKKSKADKFITKFARIYTPCVLLVSIAFIIIASLITGDWKTYSYRGLEFLVVACPCAIVLSVPLAYFSALGLGSKNGILIKGSNYIDSLVNMGKLVTDKTGTLTHGAFEIKNVYSEIDKDTFLDYVYAAEIFSSHPLGKAICHDIDKKKYLTKQRKFTEVAGLGIETSYKGHKLLVGSIRLMKMYNIKVKEITDSGSIIYAALDNQYIGAITLSDKTKKDAQPMVDLLHKEKVELILLTGDKEESAKSICNELGIDRYHASLLPEDKLKYLLLEKENTSKSVAFIGDGINDAPSIKAADIGIAMGGIGSDIAVQNSDIVILNDNPVNVYYAIKIAKMARNTSIFNIVFAIAVKIIVMILCALGIAPMIVAVLADTGLTVLLVINSLLLLYRKVKR